MMKTKTQREISSGARLLFYVLKEFARGKNWPECWPGVNRLTTELGKSVRTVRYYLRELVAGGEIEIIARPGKANVYRICGSISRRPLQPIAGVPLQPIAPQPLQPIAGVPLQPIAPPLEITVNREADTTASSAGTEVPAAAAELLCGEEDMKGKFKDHFEILIGMGMPPTPEMAAALRSDPDFADRVVRHCKARFTRKGKPVLSPGGYIVECVRNPAKFGILKTNGRWQTAGEASERSEESLKAREAVRKAANDRERLKRQEDAEKAYADMRATWDKLPEEARQQIRDFVAKDSPLLHQCGADVAEFELMCMREATSVGRTNWLRRHQGLPPLPHAWASKRG